MPSEREAAILSAQDFLSSGVMPQESSGVRPSGTAEIAEGCVGQDSSPAMSVFGTGFSSTGMSGAPLVRLRTKTRPIVVVVALAGGWCFQVMGHGCEAMS